LNLENIDLNFVEELSKQAGSEIMKIYQRDFEVNYKEDNSPLTEADLVANKIITEALNKKYPEVPIMSEENEQIDYEIRKNWEYYWCIDPIDGTKEFVKKNGEFTINIALIHKNSPVLGVVFAPVLNDIYSAKKGSGAFKNGQKLPLFQNKNQNKILNVVASKSHRTAETDEFINNLDTENINLISKGSSLKLCLVAEGTADIYPRLSPTMEWDTSAGDAIVRETGKMTFQFDSDKPLIYNKQNLLNPSFIVK
jgi:3'(2'), 5'-bisphosphate nucleotidase